MHGSAMTARLVFRRSARSEIVEARDWYNEQRKGLGTEFADGITSAVEKIAVMPTAAPVVLKDIRVRLVDRFPYAIYYRIKSKYVRILAVVHTSRDPAVWTELE